MTLRSTWFTIGLLMTAFILPSGSAEELPLPGIPLSTPDCDDLELALDSNDVQDACESIWIEGLDDARCGPSDDRLAQIYRKQNLNGRCFKAVSPHGANECGEYFYFFEDMKNWGNKVRSAKAIAPCDGISFWPTKLFTGTPYTCKPDCLTLPSYIDKNAESMSICKLDGRDHCPTPF